MECHKEIADRLTTKKGYHAQLGMQNPNGKDCVRCHLEHNGEDFSLLHWDPPLKQFDHRLAGYSLVEKHSAVACEKCHTPAHMVPALRALIKKKNLPASFCTTCHAFDNWLNAKFDHSSTGFLLTNGHANVACSLCHINNNYNLTIAPADCGNSGCHLSTWQQTNNPMHSPSGTAFAAANCSTRHTTASWTQRCSTTAPRDLP